MTRTRVHHLALRALLAGACLALGLATTALLANLRPAPAPAETERVEDPPSTAVSGLLTDRARAVLDSLPGDTAVVVLLRAHDLSTCEDLGRQLRELRRSAPAAVPLVVVTESADVFEALEWLRRERLRGVSVLAAAPDSFVADAHPLPTPAAVLLYRGEMRVEGVAHPRRARNTRSRSFAEELGLLTRDFPGEGEWKPFDKAEK